ncbi:hypothetical protein DKT75_10580 [Leucothrix arctica]|uniref:Tat pathway signal protein n=2 Tax=Leucothrix arctica TaxID=1481894 RepID=A0A317CDE8_9GAMM|nr:hypothetical protein DKT75_10580 [Leucothrix arctica]
MMSNNTLKNRRDFLKTLLAGGATGALGSVGQLALMREAMAATPAFSDYKAMVCVFMYGGNDSFNMLIPTGSDSKTGYNAYAESRGDLSVANTALPLGDGYLGRGSLNPYYDGGSDAAAYLKGNYPMLQGNGFDLGVNGVMPELAQLLSQNKASVVANVGNLVERVTRAGIKAEIARLPLFLFAHNHQQRALQTGQGDNLNDVGWAGRIADSWPEINNGSLMGLNISYAGSDRMLIGANSNPLVFSPGSPPEIYDMQNEEWSSHQDRIALYKALTGVSNTSATGDVSFDQSSTFTSSDPFKSLFSSASNRSLNIFELIDKAWNNHDIGYSSKDSYGNELFSVPSSSDLGLSGNIGGRLISQLESVAKMIDMGAKDAFQSGGYKRQIFMVSLGSFDTHSKQETEHPLLLRELSLGLSKFQTAMEELGHANKVTSFTMSDFGRTLGNNGDGTDHAWGAHHLVMGGDGANNAGNLMGGQMLGKLPDVTIDGADDYSHKGRIIPTTAQDQLNASLCRWFGIDDALMPTIFPNLGNFVTSSGDLNSAYLDGLFA